MDQRNHKNQHNKRPASPEYEKTKSIVKKQQVSAKVQIIFRCKTCRFPFINRQKLHAHYRNTHNYVICHTCNATFLDRMYLQEHYNLTHKANKTFCVQCKISFKSIEEFIAHCSTIHYNKDTEEEQNSELVDGDVADEKSKDTSLDNWTLQCKICKSILPSIEELMTHYNDKHKAKKHCTNLFNKCTICSKMFISIQELVNHCKTVHNTFDPNDYKCNICEAEFGSYNSLSSHYSRVHNTLSPRNKCQICSQEFVNIHILATHTKNVHSCPDDSQVQNSFPPS